MALRGWFYTGYAIVITAAGDEHFSVGMHLKQLTADAGSRGGVDAILDQRLHDLHCRCIWWFL